MSSKPRQPRSARLQTARRNGPTQKELGGQLAKLAASDPIVVAYLAEPQLLTRRTNVAKRLHRAQGLSKSEALREVDGEIFSQPEGPARDRIIAALKAIESSLGKERRAVKAASSTRQDEGGEAIMAEYEAPEPPSLEEQFQFDTRQILNMYKAAFGALP